MNETLQIEDLRKSLRTEPFTAADRAFVQLLEDQFSEMNPFVLIAAAATVMATRESHSYLDLIKFQCPPSLSAAYADLWPEADDWKAFLLESAAIGTETDNAPLVFDGETALYLRKYFEYERDLAIQVATKAETSRLDATNNSESQTDPNDLQQIAVAEALRNKLYIISGGPGTGKTTTVLDYLITALGNWNSHLPCRIAAVAPTGKAAARLSESIRKGLDRFSLDEPTENALLEIPCMTIHRLLQGLPNKSSFRRSRNKPIEYDVLIVDESSMIDLPLMRKLFDAIPVDCSIVMLGDHNQLSSVEVGSVFGDLLRSTTTKVSPLFGKSTSLEKTYRFSENSSIHQFCEASRTGDIPKLDQLLDGNSEDFDFSPIKHESRKDLDLIVSTIVENYRKCADSKNLEAAYQSISQFVSLTPFNHGDFGSRSINSLADSKIRRIHELEDDSPYPGMPLIVLENNYDMELFNGDIGIVWPDESTGELFAWFADSNNALKRVRLNWLPKHELAFCLTIHKSQGSEFDHVAGIFSPEDNDFISRELVYTCASRAKKRLSIFANRDALANSIQRSVNRATRLEERILSLSSIKAKR